MNERKYWAWLVKTAKGDFFIAVIGDWTQEEASQKLRKVFDTLKLDIVGMTPRKRATGQDDMGGTIIQQLEPKDALGFDFMAGKKFWDVCGRGVEYEAQMVALEKDMKQGGVLMAKKALIEQKNIEPKPKLRNDDYRT